jgi:hypothetical protein
MGKMSLSQNSANLVRSPWEKRLTAVFFIKSKVAVPKTEVLGQPQINIFFMFLGISLIFPSCVSIKNLNWTKDDFEISEALLGDVVTIVCDVKNISDGEIIVIEVYDYNDNGNHDFIETFEVRTNNKKIISNYLINEEVFEREELQCAIELKELGYTIPRYFFMVKYKNFKSKPGKIIQIKDTLYIRFRNEPLQKKATLVFPDGTIMDVELTGKETEIKYVPIGQVKIIPY